MRRSPQITALLMSLLYLALAVGSGGASVLCFGEDGHVAVEAGHNGQCGPEEHAPVEPCECGEQDDHCGACVDIPLSLDSHKGHSSRHVLASSTHETCLIPGYHSWSLGIAARATAPLFPIPPPQTNSSRLQFVRAVRLLI